MIARLAGTLIDRHPPVAVIDVGGVGYELQVPMSTFAELPEAGAEVALLVHTGVREEVPVLYGFASAAERRLFRVLIRVSGIGPKMALGILSGMTPRAFRRAIEQGDVGLLTRLPGIGRKGAERMVTELRDRLGEIAEPGAAPAGGAEILDVSEPASGSPSPLEEAREALTALGYGESEARRLLKGLEGGGAGSDWYVREALRRAVSR